MNRLTNSHVPCQNFAAYHELEFSHSTLEDLNSLCIFHQTPTSTTVDSTTTSSFAQPSPKFPVPHRQARAHDIQTTFHEGPEAAPSISPGGVICADAVEVGKADTADDAGRSGPVAKIPDDRPGGCGDCEVGQDPDCVCSKVESMVLITWPPAMLRSLKYGMGVHRANVEMPSHRRPYDDEEADEGGC